MAKKNSQLLILVVIMFCTHTPFGWAEPLAISSNGKSVIVDVEIAETADQRQVGLMNRTHLPEKSAMLFDFGKEKTVTMWMKNTLIPLDMMFTDAEGRINHIHENAVPHDLSIISSPYPSRWVLEVNAGFSERHGIKVGDQLLLKSLNKKEKNKE